MICSGQSTPSDRGIGSISRWSSRVVSRAHHPPGDGVVSSWIGDHADICPPGIYFSSLPRSKARHHRARIHFLSYYPNIRKSPGSELIHSPPGPQCLVRQFYVVWETFRRSFDPHTQNSIHIWESRWTLALETSTEILFHTARPAAQRRLTSFPLLLCRFVGTIPHCEFRRAVTT